MNKISWKAFLILILTSFFLIGGWFPNLWAATRRVHDGGDNLDTTPIDIGGGWTLTGATVVQNETAEGTANAIRIDAGTASSFIYSCLSPGSNWTPYAAFYMAMWLYSNDSSGTDMLSIIITEEDPDGSGVAGTGVPQTWTLTAPISLIWTGWRYVSVRLPEGTIGNDFTPLPATEPDATQANFNPAPVVAIPGPGWAASGVTSIRMTLTNASLNNPSIYVDRIALSPGLATVSQIFPTDDVQAAGKTIPDVVLDRAPYTISAVLSGAGITHALNRISIIYSNDSDNPFPGTLRNDGNNGLFITPYNTPSPAPPLPLPPPPPPPPPLPGGQSYTVFIMPVDIGGATGEAEVITFRVSPPGTAVGTEYHREVTER